MNIKNITMPIDLDQIKSLKAGDSIKITGTIYTARDAAHKRLVELIHQGKQLPFELKNAAIYYAGPCPATPNEVIGPCGPTTSIRMDAYAPTLLERGLKVMIGKGQRTDSVIQSISKNKAVYLTAVGGAAALISQCIKSSEVIAFKDLETEAIRKLYVKEMPLTVAIDSYGTNLFKIGPQNFRKN